MNTKPGKGSTIEVHEISAADLPAYGFINEPGRTVQMDSLVSAMNEDQFLRADDIVLIVKGSVGKVGVISGDAPGRGPGGWIAGQSAIVLRLKDASKIDAKALALQLRSEIGQNLLKNIVSDATIPLIQLRELTAMPVMLPSVEEQRHAAQVLEEEARLQRKIDDLREEQSKLAAGLWSLDPQQGRVSEMSKHHQPIPLGQVHVVQQPADGTQCSTKFCFKLLLPEGNAFRQKALSSPFCLAEHQAQRC